MNKTAILILLVFLLGATGAFVAWSSEEAPDFAALESDPWLEEPLSEPSDTWTEDLAAKDSGEVEKEDAEDGVLEGLESISREEVAGEGGDVRFLVVQVWDRKKGVPAIETDVFFLDGFDGPELKDPFAQHWSSMAEGRGQRFKTDANGRVELPPVRQWAMVTAQAAGTYGFAKFGRRHRRVETITLQTDETVTVRVVASSGADGKDRPVAGVPVGIVQETPVRQESDGLESLVAQMKDLDRYAADLEKYIRANPGQRAAAATKMRGIRERQGQVKRAIGRAKGSERMKGGGRDGGKGKRRLVQNSKQPKARPKSRTETRARRVTDKDGIAVFRHFQIYRRYPKKWWPAESVDQFAAVLLMPLQKPETTSFSGRPVSTETLVLRLPPTGSIALRTVDLEGRPYRHPVHADLRVQAANAVPWARLQERKEQNETEIVFPFVGLGMQFTARCRLDDEDFKWSVPEFAGPDNPGERRTIDVVVAPREGMLFGRLLDAAGQPIAGLRPSFLINTSVGRLEGEDVTTDVEGRFHLPYQVRNQHRSPFRLEIRHKGVRPVAGLAMNLAALPAGRVTDLGDLRFGALPLLSHGVVTDDRGQPIRGASLQLQRERMMEGKQPRPKYVDEAFVAVRTDADGRYEIFGELESSRYRLRVQANNHFPFESPDIRQGEQLDLDLIRNSKIVGTVLTPEFLRSKRVGVTLESVTHPKSRREDRVRDHKGKRYIYFDWVRPGIYSVVVRIEEFPDPILRIDGLVIEPGQQGVHPRLRDVDLSSFLHRFEISAVDERGQSIQPDWPLVAQIMRSSGTTSFLGFPWRKKRVEIISASPELEVWPMATGYSYAAGRTVLGPGKSQLSFLKIPPVELRMPGLRRLVGDGLVWIALRSIGEASAPGGARPSQIESFDGRSRKVAGQFARRHRGRNGSMLGQGDILRIELMADGPYRVMAYLLATGKSRTARAVAVNFGKIDVRLVPGAEPRKLTVNYDAKRVQNGLAELARREAAAGGGRK